MYSAVGRDARRLVGLDLTVDCCALVAGGAKRCTGPEARPANRHLRNTILYAAMRTGSGMTPTMCNRCLEATAIAAPTSPRHPDATPSRNRVDARLCSNAYRRHREHYRKT
jgi:hypothetical protein